MDINTLDSNSAGGLSRQVWTDRFGGGGRTLRHTASFNVFRCVSKNIQKTEKTKSKQALCLKLIMQ